MTGFLKHAFNPVPSENPGSEPTNVSILSVIDISFQKADISEYVTGIEVVPATEKLLVVEKQLVIFTCIL